MELYVRSFLYWMFQRIHFSHDHSHHLELILSFHLCFSADEQSFH